MAIKEKYVKQLWGRSGNRCAICKIELTQDTASVTATFNLGEQAHIVGEKDTAARGVSPLSLEERNSYHNLILLCPNDHTIIDGNPADWPVEKLYVLKSQHEAWVAETLSNVTDMVKLAKSKAVAVLVDSAVANCQLENWKNWTSYALSVDLRWSPDLIESIFEFLQKVQATIWPKEFKDLELISFHLARTLNTAAQTFARNSEQHGDTLYPYKFYKHETNGPDRDASVKKYENWVQDCHNLIREATKAANLFADIVRRDINPMFFIENGRFQVLEGDILGYSSSTYTYTDSEVNEILAGEN